MYRLTGLSPIPQRPHIRLVLRIAGRIHARPPRTARLICRQNYAAVTSFAPTRSFQPRHRPVYGYDVLCDSVSCVHSMMRLYPSCDCRSVCNVPVRPQFEHLGPKTICSGHRLQGVNQAFNVRLKAIARSGVHTQQLPAQFFNLNSVRL